MPIPRTPIIDDDGSGTTGTVLDNAWKQELYNQIDTLSSAFQAVPFSAANFSAIAPMTWTVGAAAVVENRYGVINRNLMVWSFYLSWFSGGNVLGGAPGGNLVMVIPGGRTMAANTNLLIPYNAGIAGVSAAAGLNASKGSGGTTITIAKSTGGNYALTDTPGMIATLIFEVAVV